jgi:hypothetical protein
VNKPPRKGRALDYRSKLAIENVLSGKSRTQALRDAGYSPSYSTRRAGWFFSRSEVKAALEAGWDAIRKESMYTARRCEEECEKVIELAIQCRNPMSYVKAVELKARINGLLQDVLRIEHVDIRSALTEANARRTLPWTSYKQIAQTVNPLD